ncbi:autotransporter secretion outer membrane protein TamA [Cricetibacter osteomyelitidis]|uniref:Translocation and assembly module subunit TamA n=2 Tax=Cricetibacter osteomyelitidis TaxID=1521931 RepID=A0A4R2T8D6_9PAST|nr:autotransporter secretion outer membrane protein TamA [Cricetibacter osteomyelitidis]
MTVGILSFSTALFSFAEENTEQTAESQETQHTTITETENNKIPVEAEVNLRLTGIKNQALAENARIYTNAISKESADGSERYQELVSEAVDKALRAKGYYGSSVSYTLEPAKGKNKPVLIAKVDIGKPVYIEETDVLIDGQAKTDPAFEKIEKTKPAKGTLLNHATYDDFKSALEKAAQSRGYFDSEFLLNRLEVMPSTQQAWWRIHFDSGERYHYGVISYRDSQIREDYLRNMLRIKTGDPYYINDLSTLTGDYSAAGWFSSVLLQPTLNTDDKTVDLEVLLHPRKKNSMSVGIGYSSDVGPRLQLGWTRPWINNRGHSLSTDLYVSAPKQTLEASYKIPILENPRLYYYEATMGLENEKDSDVDTESTALTTGFLRYWNNEYGWQYFLGLRARYDSFTQASQKDKTFLLYPTAGFSRTRSQGGMFMTWGDAQSLTFDIGRKMWISDVDFFRVRLSSAWIRTYAENHRIYIRGEVGYLNTKDLTRIPPALRYFAGGDRSVRGYGYKKISPKDSDGKLIGASRLATGTLEYQYQVSPSWWMATFFDAGLAANSFSTDELRYGAGIGVRWASPVGAVKFDLATPIRDRENNKSIQFYIGLGTEL